MIVIKQITILLLNGMGLTGLLLLVYGYVTDITGQLWPPLEGVADWLAVILTFIGTTLVAISIYFPSHSRPPDDHSKVNLREKRANKLHF